MRTSDAPAALTDRDMKPHWNWTRPIAAPGPTAVDFEERVNFDRLRRYRVARTRWALRNSGLGAVLCFDNNNIRYITASVIGEWSRDKICRYALFTADSEPYLWDFGSAATHHRLFAPWLHPDRCKAGMLGLRGSVAEEAGLFKQAAEEIRQLLQREGVAGMPIGVDICEPPMLFALQAAGLEVRDGQQTMLDARQIKSMDEIVLLNMSAAIVDGAYQGISEALKPGARENEMVALANKLLYEAGSDDVEAINAVSGERCSPHPHNFTDRMYRPGDQAFFDVIQSIWVTAPATTAPSTSVRPRRRSEMPTAGRGSGSTSPSTWSGPALPRIRSPRSGPGRRSSASPTRWKRSDCNSATAWDWPCTNAPSSAGWSPSTTRSNCRRAWCSRLRHTARRLTATVRRALKKKWW